MLIFLDAGAYASNDVAAQAARSTAYASMADVVVLNPADNEEIYRCPAPEVFRCSWCGGRLVIPAGHSFGECLDCGSV